MQKSTQMSSSSSRSFVLFPSWTGKFSSFEALRKFLNFVFFLDFSIDICQFSVTSLWNSSEDKHHSISFRSVILIMVYAGTIILNLLAASVDNTLSSVYIQPPGNLTITEVTEQTNKDNTVSDELSG